MNIKKAMYGILLATMLTQSTLASSASWSDTFKSIPTSILNWARENQGKAIIGSVAGIILAYACYQRYYCAVKPENIPPQPVIIKEDTPEIPIKPPVVASAVPLIQTALPTPEEKREEISVTIPDDIWGRYKDETFYKTQAELKHNMHTLPLGNYFTILGTFKPYILTPETITNQPAKELIPSVNFSFDLYTLLVLKDLVDSPTYIPLRQNLFYLRYPSHETPKILNFYHTKRSFERENRSISQEEKNKFTYNYKIHVMPQKNEFIPVILKISELLKNNQEFSDLIDGAKIDPDYTFNYDTLASKSNDQIIPGIILYVHQDAAGTQKALDLLYKELKDFKGNGIRPRFNAQVNNLIYVAQGNGDDKKNKLLTKTNLFEMPYMIYYNHEAFGDPTNYHLKYPGTNIEITQPERPENKRFLAAPSSWKISWAFARRNGSVYKAMEDEHDINIHHDRFKLFGVYDGHGGTLAADILAHGNQEKNIPSLSDLIINNLQQNADSPQQTVYDTFIQMDQLLPGKFTKQVNKYLKDEQQFLTEQRSGKPFSMPTETIDQLGTVGSTAILAVLDTQTDIVYLAWAGDSRAIIIAENGNILAETDDHNAQNTNEANRIQQLEPAYDLAKNKGRIGAVMTTRSFADFATKQEHRALTADPDIKDVQLPYNNAYIILASDGVWENIPKNELFHVMQHGLNTNQKRFLSDFTQQKFDYIEMDPFNETQKSYASDEKPIESKANSPQLKQFAENIRDVAFYRNIKESLGNKSLHDIDATIKSDNLTVLVIQATKERSSN